VSSYFRHVSAPDPKRRAATRRRVVWVILVIYVVLIASAASLVHTLGGDPWGAIAGLLGGLIGFLLLQTPPARRWLDDLRRGRWSDGPPRSDADRATTLMSLNGPLRAT
jgi:hypothetical protein